MIRILLIIFSTQLLTSVIIYLITETVAYKMFSINPRIDPVSFSNNCLYLRNIPIVSQLLLFCLIIFLIVIRNENNRNA